MRIIGGAWRGRMLKVACVQGLRPTPDRVRETLFNWLGQRLDGMSCLDLFAGSGALGIEAASRGAAHVTLVERDRRAWGELRQAAQRLDPQRLEVLHLDALHYLAICRRRYDIVFLDPPYGGGWIERVAAALSRVLAPHARIYAEAECAITVPGGWELLRQARAGRVHSHLLRATAP